jgi:hypothetical protein
LDGSTVESFTENPANNPVRVWEGCPGDVLEARFLVRKLTPVGKDLLTLLARRPETTVPIPEVASMMQVLDERAVSELVEWVARLSEALGFVPIVQFSELGLQVTEGASIAILKAIASEGE